MTEPYQRTVRIHGAVDDADVLLLADHLDDVLRQGPDVLVVDLSTCPRLAQGAVDLLLSAQRAQVRLGAGLEVRAADESVRDQLAAAGLVTLIACA